MPRSFKPPEEYHELKMCELFACRPSELDEEEGERVMILYELHQVEQEMLKQRNG